MERIYLLNVRVRIWGRSDFYIALNVLQHKSFNMLPPGGFFDIVF